MAYCNHLDKITGNEQSYSIEVKSVKNSTCSFDGEQYNIVLSLEHIIETFHYGMYEIPYIAKRLNYKLNNKGLNALQALIVHEYVHILIPSEAHKKKFIDTYNYLMNNGPTLRNVYKESRDALLILSSTKEMK
ncbi:MAG: hypothetical protein KC414_04815 [Romboutsia sp.]|nr:hypothetical protein [Romboutsia sp.]